MRKTVARTIKNWYIENDISESCDRVYLFGSLINDGGDFFWPAGVKNSDIDLLARINPRLDTAVLRTLALIKMHEAMPELEQELANKLGRDDIKGGIMSILPVTWYELYHCIHKGFDPKIFTLNIFYDLLTMRPRKYGLSDFIDKSFQFDNTETFAVMRLCQKLRNDFLKSDNKGAPQLKCFEHPDVVPKEIMRAAALLKFVETEGNEPEVRTNLSEGEEYVIDLLKDAKDNHELTEMLYKKVKKRNSSATYKKPPLEVYDLILLSEIMFDKARILSLPSERETIDRMRRQKQNKPVYN